MGRVGFAAIVIGLLTSSWALADELRIDGSTPETTQATIRAIYAQQDHKGICLLQAAMINIAMGEKAKRDAAGEDPKTQAPDVGVFLNGLSYAEVITKSQKEYPQKVTPVCRN